MVIGWDRQLEDWFELNDESKETILNVLVDFVVDHKQPFNIMESASFKVFCKQFNPHYSILSWSTLTHSLSDCYKQSLLIFRTVIDLIEGSVAIMLDCWSLRVMYSYIIFTIH